MGKREREVDILTLKDVHPDAPTITWKQWQLAQIKSPPTTPAQLQAWLEKHSAPRRMPGMEKAK